MPARQYLNLLAICGISILCACSHWAKEGIILTPPQKLNLALLPVQFSVKISKRKEIENVPKGEKKLSYKKEAALTKAKLEAVSQEMTQYMGNRLSRSYFFNVISLDQKIPFTHFQLPTSSAAWQNLSQSAGASIFLQIRVEGYGHIKKIWLAYLVGSGLIEGLVEGVAASFALGPKQQWIAASIGGEEALQETAEWLGGAYLLDRFFTPVILKAQLINGRTGKVFWTETATGTRDSTDLKKFPKSERKKKQIRLKAVSEAALRKIAKDIEKAAAKNEKFN